ncbi:MAG: flagellar basal body protein [Pseudomonadota bacterium]|jgi:flagellar basal-body rod protein FlgB
MVPLASRMTAPTPTQTPAPGPARGLDVQMQALVLRGERQRMIASNIANADTPGYRATDLDFAAALRDAMAGAGTAGAMPARTHAGHLGAAAPQPAAAAHRHETRVAQPGLDGSRVDMDRERASFADNALKYEATLRFVQGGVRTMLDAIRGQ